jgi:hypothetical protein
MNAAPHLRFRQWKKLCHEWREWREGHHGNAILLPPHGCSAQRCARVEEAKWRIIGPRCDQVSGLRQWLFVPFVAVFGFVSETKTHLCHSWLLLAGSV